MDLVQKKIINKLQSNLTVYKHSLNVFRLCKILYPLLPKKYFSVDYKNIQIAGLLHDIGKINWSEELFTKPFYLLTDEEKKIIKNHPKDGVEILNKLCELPEDVLYLIENHHNISSKDNNVLFISTCDVFCACIEERAYRKRPLTYNEALNEVKKFAPNLIIDVLSKKVENVRNIV